MKTEALKTLLLLNIVCLSIGATELSGDIGGMILKKEDSPFIVNDDLLIPAEKRTVIERGCVLLFKPFTGMKVEGEFIIDGTADAPVILTSINDFNYNSSSNKLPENFDWNGIVIQKEARKVKLSHFILHYSVFGIKSYIGAFTIVNGIFSNNGQFHLTIKDTMQKVLDSTPFSYGSEWDTDGHSPESKADAHQFSGTLRKLMPYISAGAGIAALASGGYFFYKKDSYHSRYLQAAEQSLMDYAISRETIMRNRAVALTFAGAVLCAGGTGLFFYDLKLNRSTTVSVSTHPFSSCLSVCLKF